MTYSITPTADINCFYHTHIQNIGWQNWQNDGSVSGTSGLGVFADNPIDRTWLVAQGLE